MGTDGRICYYCHLASRAVEAGESVGEGRPVSLFTPDPDLEIHSEGLQWPTDGVRLDNWWKATLNRATADRIILTLSHPAPVLVILG